jgi:hypothetical protein
VTTVLFAHTKHQPSSLAFHVHNRQTYRDRELSPKEPTHVSLGEGLESCKKRLTLVNAPGEGRDLRGSNTLARWYCVYPSRVSLLQQQFCADVSDGIVYAVRRSTHYATIMRCASPATGAVSFGGSNALAQRNAHSSFSLSSYGTGQWYGSTQIHKAGESTSRRLS